MLTTTFLTVQENSELLESVRGLEDKAWKLEGELRQAESMAGLRDPRTGRRRASRDQLVQTVTRQAETISRLQEQLRAAMAVSQALSTRLVHHSEWCLVPNHQLTNTLAYVLPIDNTDRNGLMSGSYSSLTVT